MKSADGRESFVNRNVTDDKKLDGARYGRRVPRALDYSESNPSVQFTVPEDGEYCVSARDLYGNARSDPRSVYRMVVKPSEPGFRLVAWSQRYRNENNNKRVERAALALLPGESREILVDVVRAGGFTGPLKLNAIGLPDGVTSHTTVVAADQTEAAVVLTADIDSPPSYGAIQIVGNATIQGNSDTRIATFGLLTSDAGNVGAERPTNRPLESIFVSVKSTSEKSPAIVQIENGKEWKSSIGAMLKIPVRYLRNAEIKGELKLNSIELPVEIKPKELVLKPDATATELEIPLNNAKIKPGSYSFFMTGQVAANFTRNQFAIAALEQQLVAFDETLKGIQNSEQDGAKKQRAEQFRKTLEERVNNAKKQNGPRDAQIVVTSTPVTINISNSPLTISTTDVAVTLPGASNPNNENVPVEVSGKLTINRHFGFADAVQVEVTIPNGHPPITVESIGKDQSAAAISGSVSHQTKPGRYEYPVTLKLQFGGVDVQDTTKLALNVLEPERSSARESTANNPAVNTSAK